jgi:Domain of unknown function (DUF4388)
MAILATLIGEQVITPWSNGIMDQKGAVTNRLTDVIRVAQLVRKTGSLLVERNAGTPQFEKGEITFVEGQVTNAETGRMSGQAAFKVMNGWGTCRFLFVPLATTRDLTLSTSQIGPTHTAPSRVRDAKDVLHNFESLGLTRLHRQVFLLIDGQRSVPDLTRLSARGAEEVIDLLSDLERAGLIRF